MEVGEWPGQLVPLCEHIHDTTSIRPSSALWGRHHLIDDWSSGLNPPTKLSFGQILLFCCQILVAIIARSLAAICAPTLGEDTNARTYLSVCLSVSLSVKPSPRLAEVIVGGWPLL